MAPLQQRAHEGRPLGELLPRSKQTRVRGRPAPRPNISLEWGGLMVVCPPSTAERCRPVTAPSEPVSWYMLVMKEGAAADRAHLRQRRRTATAADRDSATTGLSSFAEEYFYISKYEGEIIACGWARLPPEGVYASAAIAEVEGRSRFLQRHKAHSGSNPPFAMR